MKDQRFIELLNLYIDRQISVAETAELEAEIQQHPKRQAVYRQYCQIHSATKLVYDSFRVNATEHPALPSERTGVVELFETKRHRGHFAYYAGGLAAAACLALVFLHQGSGSGTGTLAAAKPAVHPVAAQPVPVAVVAVAPLQKTKPVAGPVSLRNTVTNSPDYTAMLAALREQDEERTIANGHGQPNRVQSLFEDGLFNPNPVTRPDSKLFRIQQTQAQQAETTVFQFQR